MAVRFYDEAVYNKIQKWIKDPNMVILKPNESSRLFQIQNDKNNDKPLTLPLISLARDPNIGMSVTTKRALTYEGLVIGNNEKSSVQLDAIPIELNYQLDIYTRRFDEGDEYLRNFVFNMVNHPTLKILIPYNGAEIEHICYIRVLPTLSDNSDIPEKVFPDEFTRWTIQFTINDAFLFSLPVKENGKLVGAVLHVYNDRKESSLEEVHVEDFVYENDTN